MANRVLSRASKITNRTHHGCPLSFLMFNLVMKPLEEAVMCDIYIRGIQIGLRYPKLGLFTDDVKFTLTDSLTFL